MTENSEKTPRKVIRRSGSTMVVASQDLSQNSTQYVSVLKDGKVKVIPLGGLGELGKNIWLIEYENEIYIFDCGLGHTEGESYSEKIKLPDLNYLIKNKHKIKALIISHSHDEHMGGLIHLLKQVQIPTLYGSPFVIKVVEEKLKEAQIVDSKITFEKFKPRQTIKTGSFAFTFIRSTHSICDSYSILIHSPAGKIVYTSDFKFDFTPVDGEFFDIYSLANAGNEGVLLLIGDSTNAEIEGYSPSEKSIYKNLERCFKKANGRIFVTVSPADLYRVNQLLDVSLNSDRKVLVLSRTLNQLINISKELGYLKIPDKLFVDINQLEKLPDEKICIITTGSQGDSLSVLARIAKDEFNQIHLKKEDTVLISSAPYKGNEKSIEEVINNISAKGVKVIEGGNDAKIHVSGNAGRQELRLLLNIIRPKYFLPAQGEYRMLYINKNLAKDCGMNPDNVVILNNGDILELSNNSSVKTTSKIEAPTHIFDTKAHSEIDDGILKVRDRLSRQGLVTILLTVKKSKIISNPAIDLKGLIIEDEKSSMDEVNIELKRLTLKVLKDNIDGDFEIIKEKVKEELSKFFLSKLKINPMVQVILLELN